MKYGIIYKITNLITNKSYIGQTINKDPYKRINYHFKNSKTIISKAIKSYGKENFSITLLCSCFDQKTLNEMEIYFINFLNTLTPNGYNIKLGGEQGGKLKEETKKYIGERIKEWYKNNDHPLKGKKFSKEHIAALSKVRKGFTSTNRKEARKKSAQLRAKKIKAINLKTQEYLIFDSIEKCSKELNLVSSCISRVCRKDQNRSQHNGWTFEFVKE